MSNPFGTPDDGPSNPFSNSTTYTSYNNYTYTDEAPKSFVASTTPKSAKPTDKLLDSLPFANLSESEIAAREEALRKREQAIADKENQLQQAKANGTINQLVPRKKNWPILVHIYAYYPEEDLPENSVKMVKRINWIFVIGQIAMAMNLLGVLIVFFSKTTTFKSNGTALVLAIAHCFLISPVFINYSFFTLYDALRLQRGVAYFCFMITYAIYLVWVVLCALGLENMGTLGFIHVFTISPSEAGVAFVFALLFSIVTTLMAVGIVLTFIMAWRYYVKVGLNKKTVGEASKYAMKYAAENKDVLIDAAKENPELAMDIAKAATQT